MRPSLRTWATAAAAIGSAAGAWIVVLTTFESPFLDAVRIDPAMQLLIGAAVAAAVGVFVWALGRAVLGHESRRDVAFAEVLKEGNELVAPCRQPKPEGASSEVVLATLTKAWEDWDGRAWAVVKKWGTQADQEVYSAENPWPVLSDRSKIADNVKARCVRLQTMARSRG